MAKFYYKDAYCLGLLYSYLYAGKTMVLKDDLDAFHKAIEGNLEKADARDIDIFVWFDDEEKIYYPSVGKNNEVYYVLYPDINIEEAKAKYIGCLTIDDLLASQEENALSCLGLQLQNGHICRKDTNIRVGITGGNTFMDNFINKLKSGELKIEKCPQVETDDFLTEEYIIEQLESYQRLLKTPIIQNVLKDESESNPSDSRERLVDSIKKVIKTNLILEVFSKDYKDETEYREFMQEHIDDFKLGSKSKESTNVKKLVPNRKY